MSHTSLRFKHLLVTEDQWPALPQAPDDDHRCAGQCEHQAYDVRWFTHLDPPVTAISQPVAELGTRAVRTLLDHIGSRSAPSAVLSASLVVRRPFDEDSADGNSPGAKEM